MQGRAQFWESHPGLVWSNADAPDEVWIRAALFTPPGIEDLAAFFTGRRDELEAALAAEKLS